MKLPHGLYKLQEHEGLLLPKPEMLFILDTITFRIVCNPLLNIMHMHL